MDWNSLTVDVVVKEGEKVLHQFRANPAASADGAVLREMIKANATEALNDHRFFGNLRAAIAWLPAVIVLTLISYIAQQLESPAVETLVVLGVVQLATFALIFFAQLSLQWRQARRLNVATESQDQWKQLAKGEAISVS